MSSTLRVLPLGGLGEIGKNMMVLEYEGAIVVVDVGLRFPTAEMVGIDLVLPDFSYLRDRIDDIEGDRRHPRPRGPPRRAALGAARAEPRHPRLRRPAHDGDGPLEARRAPPARGRRERPQGRRQARARPVRRRARPHDALDPRRLGRRAHLRARHDARHRRLQVRPDPGRRDPGRRRAPRAARHRGAAPALRRLDERRPPRVLAQRGDRRAAARGAVHALPRGASS